MSYDFFPYYESENLWLVALSKNSNVPEYRKGESGVLGYDNRIKPSFDALYHLAHSSLNTWTKNQSPYNLGVMCGRKSEKNGLPLYGFDFDAKRMPSRKRPDIKENLEWYRSWDTWVNFTPSGGFHVLFRCEPRSFEWKQARYLEGMVRSLPRTDFHSGLNLVRKENGMLCIPPSVRDGRAYFWLDNAPAKGKPIRIL